MKWTEVTPRVAPGWQSKVDGLIHLIDDQGDKPEGRVARAMLARILAEHPAVAHYQQFKEFTTRDLARMKRAGVSTDGHWEGRTLDEAIANMVGDYRQRLGAADNRRKREVKELHERDEDFSAVG